LASGRNLGGERGKGTHRDFGKRGKRDFQEKTVRTVGTTGIPDTERRGVRKGVPGPSMETNSGGCTATKTKTRVEIPEGEGKRSFDRGVVNIWDGGWVLPGGTIRHPKK